jgi:hypothetical protein
MHAPLNSLAHVLVGEPASIPDQVRDRLLPEHALMEPEPNIVAARFL